MDELKPPDALELRRMLHALGTELWLPGSPVGDNPHQALSQASRHLYGVKSMAELTPEQMRQLYMFLYENKRLPKRGEI